MFSIPAQDFEELNINLKSPEIIFKNTVYIRHQVVSKKYREIALNLIKEISTDGLKSILIEHNLFFTIWLEKVSSLTNNDKNEIIRIHPSIMKEKQMIEEKDALEDIVNQRLKDLGI